MSNEQQPQPIGGPGATPQQTPRPVPQPGPLAAPVPIAAPAPQPVPVPVTAPWAVPVSASAPTPAPLPAQAPVTAPPPDAEGEDDEEDYNTAYAWLQAKEKFDAFMVQHQEGPTTSDIPIVIVPGGLTTITESSEKLFQAIAPHKQLFYRGGVVVELLKEGNEYDVKILDATSAQSRFEKYAYFMKRVQGSKVPAPTNITEAIAKQYLKSEACRTILPKLNGVLHCPLIVEKDGKLHRVEKGYDETTGFFITATRPVEQVNLEDAVSFLTSLLDDFDFVTPGDRSRAIASLITPALKLGGLITGPIPVDVAEANVSQSGKTYRQKLVAALYNQKLAVVTKKAGGVGSMEETFADHLIKGKAFIQFDNVRGKLDSQYLESMMTADGMISARVPYSSSVAIDPAKFVLFISSNGFETTKDLTNRTSIIRIRKRQNYHYRTHQGRDILGLAFLWQPLFTGALFTVIEEWFRQGKPKTNDTRHDFREWCQSLDWIVQNIFHEAPLMDGHEAAKERAASKDLSFLRLVAVKLGEHDKLNQPLSASDIASVCMDAEIDIPGLTIENQTVEQGPQQIGKIMGSLFKDRAEVAFDEFRVARHQERVKTEAGNFQTSNRYAFSLIDSAPKVNPTST